MTSLRRRLIFAIVGVSFGSATLVGAPFYRWSSQSLDDTRVAGLVGNAEMAGIGLPIAEILRGAPEKADAWRQELADIRREVGLTDVWVVDRAGHVVLTSSGRALTDLDADALARVWAGDPTWTPVYHGAVGGEVQTAYAPIDVDDDGEEDAAVGVEGRSDTAHRLAELQRWFALGALGLAVCLITGATIAAQAITAPLDRLVRAAQAVGAGATPDPVHPSDTTEIEALRRAFFEMAARVQQRERWLRSLAGAVAHEIRNPVNGARLHTGLLRRELAVAPPSTRQRLAVVEHELDQLEQTVASFVAFAREGTVVRRPVRLRDWLDTVTDASVQADDVEVDIDPILLGRAVANLVHNAEQAGGAAQVEARLHHDALTIDVRDDGPGFRAEVLAHVFEPFNTDRPEGTGLGLAVVAAIAAAHGGTATVTRPGPGGTEVRLVIPAGR